MSIRPAKSGFHARQCFVMNAARPVETKVRSDNRISIGKAAMIARVMIARATIARATIEAALARRDPAASIATGAPAAVEAEAAALDDRANTVENSLNQGQRRDSASSLPFSLQRSGGYWHGE